VPQAVRDVAEKSTAQAKENFEKMSAAAGEETNLMKSTYSTTFKGAQDYSTKVLEFAHVNINAAFEHAKKLASLKSPAEFFALSNDHLRQQFEIFSRQAQELAAIAQKMTAATTDSVKAGVQKAT
jgi:phasin